VSKTGFLIRVLLLTVAVWAGGFLAFANRVAAPASTPGPAGGISVLTGSAGRILAGISLLKQRPQARMLITGVGDGTAAPELAAAFPAEKHFFDCCIELDRHAKDTVGNAEQTALWVRRNGLDSVVVVTSASHMPRSLVEMRRQMKAIRLEALPTGAGRDAPGRWWWHWPSLRRFAVEYHKYLFSLVRARLLDNIGDMRSG
jgi:uncharacterized SAM-binding protein YcdF (DUF218 family)